MSEQKLLPVEHHPGFAKDPKSGAILNTDNDRLRAYKKQKRIMQETVRSSQRLDKLEQDMSDVKSMLMQILGKL